MTPSRWARTWWWLYVGVAVLDLVAGLAGRPILFGVGLVALMPLLTAFLVTARRQLDPDRQVRLLGWVTGALAFSWLGDSAGRVFLVKVALFLVAQGCYVAGFWPYRSRSWWRWPPLASTYAAAIALLIVVVARHAGPLAAPVVVYGITLALMATLSTGVSRAAGLGGALFVVSDAILALDTFVPALGIPYASVANIASYAAAQALLVRGALHRAR
jgi:uncharacterized membrane protein YhhN